MTRHHRSRRRHVFPAAAMLLVSSIAASGCSRAATNDGAGTAYPNRDVTMIVPFGPGGGSDVLSRTIGNVITELGLLPVPLLVENRPGASGAVGYTYVARQTANPYTLATVSVSFFTTPLLGASDVTYRDFTPVAAIAMSPYVMAVRAASPIRSIDDIRRSKRLTTGTVGVVSDPVLLARMLQNASGVTIDTVPFDGEGEVMAATLGGHIDFMLGNPGEIIPQIQAGTLRAIGVSTADRLQILPDTPTFKEAGYPIDHVQLRGVVMPGGVPAETVSYWEGVLRQVAESEQWKREYLDRFRDEARFLDSAAFGAELERANQLYAKTMTELGLLKR